MDTEPLAFPALTTMLKAAGEVDAPAHPGADRRDELAVSDLTEILGQSQPRVSRHLRLLAEAGLVERFRTAPGRSSACAGAAARPTSPAP